MSGQGDAAAERSAHVSRGEGGAWGPSLIVERDGAALLRVTAERDAARAEAARLREAVTRAAAQFSYYEQQHRAKGTADADAKADTNRDMAAMLRAALGETTDGR